MKLMRITMCIMIISTLLCACDNLETKKEVDFEPQIQIDELELEIKNLEIERNKLIKEKEKLNIKINEYESKNTDMKNEVESTNLRECELFLYDSYANGEMLSVPAYGPLATLNPYAVNISSAMNIISQDEHLTKVRIEGYIPTWYIDKDKNVKSYEQNRYIINDCELYLSPNADDKLVNKLAKGDAVKVKYEYEGWKYISLYLRSDSNEITNGWVDEKYLGSIDDLDSIIGINVKIKKGSKCQDGENILEVNENMWGKIFEEKEESYMISLPGAWLLEVNKSDVEFLK